MPNPPPYRPGKSGPLPYEQMAAWRLAVNAHIDLVETQIRTYRGRLSAYVPQAITKGYMLIPGTIQAPDALWCIVRYIAADVPTFQWAWADKRNRALDTKQTQAIETLGAWLARDGWSVTVNIGTPIKEYYAPEIVVYPKKGGDAPTTP